MALEVKIHGLCVNADEAPFEATIRINLQTGMITKVTRGTADIKGAYKMPGHILPGCIDLHVHGRQDTSGKHNYKEDFKTLAAAATNGGVVLVCDMPNNPVPPADERSLEDKYELSKGSAIPILHYAAIKPGSRPFGEKIFYKIYLEETTGDIHFASFKESEETLVYYPNECVSYHCGCPATLEMFKTAATHEERRPAEGEMSGVDFAIAMAERLNQKIKICHCTICANLPKIRAARERGVKISVEVSPIALFFDRTMIDHVKDPMRAKLLQINPPLRTPIDRMHLIDALKKGLIDFLATDHAPHLLKEKEKGASGMPQLDIYVPFLAWLYHKQGFSLQDIVRISSANAADFIRPHLGIPDQPYGRIAENYVGSLSVIDLSNPVTITREMLRTKCGWSPFEGFTFPGRSYATVVKGTIFRPQYLTDDKIPIAA